MVDVLLKLQKQIVKWGIKDRMAWSNSRSDKFLVKAFYSFLASRDLEVFAYEVIWNSWF